MCNEEIPKGSKCYDQSVKAKPFQKKTKVCNPCVKKLIKLGYELAPKKKK